MLIIHPLSSSLLGSSARIIREGVAEIFEKISGNVWRSVGRSVLKVSLILFNFTAVILGFPQSLSITIENRCVVHLHWFLRHVSNSVMFKLNYCTKLCLFINILR